MALHNPSANPVHSCRYNERLILHLLRIHDQESKANLARYSGLTAAAVGGLVSLLEQRGLVMEMGKLQGDLGQPATLYSLDPKGAFGIGVSINRGHIETLLIDFVGKVVAGIKHDIILPEPDAVLDLVRSDIEQLTRDLNTEEVSRIVGIGVALPFHLESWQVGSERWQQWRNFDFANSLEKKVGISVWLENDGNLAALAELIYGTGKQCKDFVYLFFGPALVKSVGGGVVVEGAVRQGQTGNAGDLGLIPVPPSPLVNKNDDWVFLTDRCSFYSLVEYLRSLNCTIDNRRNLSAAIEQHPEAYRRWIDDCVNALETAIFSVQAVLDFSLVVVDCEDEDRELLNTIAADLSARLQTQTTRSRPLPQLAIGGFGSNAAAIGAATMPMDELFSLR